MTPPHRFRTFAALALLLLALRPCSSRAETMIQYFNTDWAEITQKIPELAEAGYDAIWLPPPTKGSGGLSVGYDLFDRFDLGSKDQRGSIRTRYGTEGELLRLIETAHRFGIRIYLDNVMNHNSFDVPGYNESTPIDLYPGFVPEDFHLRLTPEGFYRKWDNIRDYNSEWQVQHLGLADLIDIAQEPGTTNENFGATEGSTFPKVKFIRHPNSPEYYCYDASGNYVGFGPNNGLTVSYLAQHSDFYSEYVQDFLNRSARWILDRTKADGFRLDAVKHVSPDFFGATYGADKDFNDYGYLGQTQRQFNLTHGFNDAKFNYPAGDTYRSNLRESVFDTEKPRHNAMVFGEHLGEPPSYSGYFNAGMRLVDNVLRGNLNNVLGNPSATLNGLDGDGSYGFSSGLAVMHAQSHDNDYASRRELQHALYFTRAGIGLIYTDGNHQAQTLGQSGGAFPRHANTNFLGQYSDPRIPNLLSIHNQFARGSQVGRWSDNDVVAYERIDKRENSTMSDADGATLLFMMNDNYASGQGRVFNTSFAHTAGGADSYLYNYSTYGGGFYQYASNIVNGSTIIPPGGYFAFSWRSPEESNGWSLGGGKPLTILQSGQAAGALTYVRKDGPDGDPNFNPYGVAGAVAGSYSYPYTIPRITDASNLSFIARTDGSTENMLFKLDGGIDLNGGGNSNDPVGKRDYPPGLSTDVFLGYEQPNFVDRTGPEKFAATLVAHDTFGSSGAETYTVGGTTVTGAGTNPSDIAAATFVYHDPTAGFGSYGGTHPTTQLTSSGNVFQVWAKTNGVGAGLRMYLYYTGDGSNPGGAAGVGLGTTQVAEMTFQGNEGTDDWWRVANLSAPAGTVKYKIGIAKTGQSSQFPSDANGAFRKKQMVTTFQVSNFNGATKVFYPHDDFGQTQTGLSEGFHVLRARAFLKRDGASLGNGLRSSIFNTFTQTFYYDAQPPQGEIKFPAENDAIGGSVYGVVVRTDPSVTEVWYHIDDSDPSNDDTVTRTRAGNGGGFEPFTDANSNGIYDAGEAFQDLNGNGVWDGNLATSWVLATEVTPNPSVSSSYQREWRFDYANIPASGTAQIKVRLRELSSSPYKDFSLSDGAGHYTTLVRNVTTAGPSVRMFIPYPQNNGDQVDSNYILKVWFSKSLAGGLTPAQLLSRFLIRIGSSESGTLNSAVTEPQASYSINYDVTSDYDELAFQLPNLYNGLPDFLHDIDVTYTATGQPTLEASRLVKAKVVSVIKDTIVTPPEVDSDGKIYQIVLPDVANPTPAQRAVPIQVETDAAATSVAVNFSIGSGNITLNPNTSDSPNPSTVGGSKFWNFTWNNVSAGDFQFISTVTTPDGSAMASRDAHIVFRQLVATSSKQDIDDDGLGYYIYDSSVGPVAIETTSIPLPTTNSELWTNDQVHLWAISGRTNPLSPDSDGEGLSDGLELGWAGAVGDTDATTDTNGDGVPNFQPDLDPPVYNTTDKASAPSGYDYFNPWPYNLNNSRTDQIAGSVTDPNKPDTDDDGVNDGLEDRTLSVTLGSNNQPIYRVIHNGRVDILPNGVDGENIIAHPPTVYNRSRTDRTRVLSISPNAVWLETDPNNPDTDGDGVPDGQEDADHNGIVDLAIIDRNQVDGNGNYVVLGTFSDPRQILTVTGTTAGTQPVTFRYSDFCYTYREPTDLKTYYSTALSTTKLNSYFRPGGQVRPDQLDVVWLETDPRRFSTTGDALPDGWKLQHGLDPFSDGMAGHYNLRTGKVIGPGDPNGVDGDPDGDGVSNLQEYINGSDPLAAGTPAPPPPGAITIGPGISTTVGSVTNKHEFTDWTANDLIALDPYDGDGTNKQGSDIYHGYDGFDSSRDMVAFYAHDGGDPALTNPVTGQKGDGNFYFRVDLSDLQAYAEQGNLDIYVVVNFGNPHTGEFNLPDQVDTGTSMGWQAVVASYQTDKGAVYLWNKNSPTHSTGIGQDLSQFGVTVRDQTSANGFKKAFYNSDLDAVEFSISRQALLDAGWDGNDATKLIYQVFTTRDGTQDNPPGAGDIGGRSDIRDSIRNDGIASDYYLDQANITGSKSVLSSWVGLQADNDRGKRVKVMSVIHGNQALQPGTIMQDLINNGQGAGLYRPLDVHQAFGVPLAMHITPTAASAIQWAKVASSSTRPYRDGPALNAKISSMMANGTLDLLGSTFSDHILGYYDSTFSADNVALARDFLTRIYGQPPSSAVLWTPERASSADVIQKVGQLGYNYTFVDQLRHLWKWFGRTSALGSDGYRVNQINGENLFVINDGVSAQLFTNDDNGLPVLLRQLLNRKARSIQQDQVVTFVNQWENFSSQTNADAYDKNIRWFASHPWIEIVTPDQIAADQSGHSTTNTGTTWNKVARGTGVSLSNVAKDFVDHATEENYDNWYNGSGLEESLVSKKFNLRTGIQLGTAFGLQSSSGVAHSTWLAVNGIAPATGNDGLISLARATMHAAQFETAFHDQTNVDLSKFSTGVYINPDTSFQSLAGFAKIAQAQTREAAIYARVNNWATAAAQGDYLGSVMSDQVDVDLDGENEYLLYNDRLCVVFERLGGRMIGAWLRDVDTGYVTQVIGNLASYAGSETEEEGNSNYITSNGALTLNAFRTSGFKDWYAKNGTSLGTSQYVNDYYTATAVNGGWKFTSSDGKISKTLTLTPSKGLLQASYNLSGYTLLYVRFGLSPDLLDLFTSGQAHLSNIVSAGSDTNLFNNGTNRTVRAFLRTSGGSYTGASYNSSATDIDSSIVADTVSMRNQAQTQQIELQGGSTMSFALGFETGRELTYDSDGDGIPDWWTQQFFGHPTGQASDLSRSGDDADHDGLSNLQEYIFGSNPVVADGSAAMRLTIVRATPSSVKLSFPTVRDRSYQLYYTNSLTSPNWQPAGAPLLGDGASHDIIDDGTSTGSAPTTTQQRFYRLQVSLIP